MNVGVSALVANQQALTTTGHNIANVNTAGYSRQSVALKALQGQNSGTGYIGKGVQVSTVLRHYDALLNRQSNAANAASAADTARYQALVQMQEVYTGGDSSLGAAINEMMNAFADAEAAPTDSTARNVVLTRISELTARFRAASASLEELDYATQQQLHNNVQLVNGLSSQVAALNAQIARSMATGHSPNDLLDAREQLVREINQYVQTSQVAADDGTVSLFIGGSQALVMGSSAATLTAKESTQYPGSQKLSLYFSQPNGEEVELTANMLSGGSIAGQMKFNNDDLVVGRNLLGRMALTIGAELNQQNRNGLTLSGNAGTDLFKLSLSSVGYNNTIPGYDRGDTTKSASANIVDTRALVASDYTVVFGEVDPNTNTRAIKLHRMSDGTITDYAVSTSGGSITKDGVQFELPAHVMGNASKGNSILFQPYNAAAEEVQALIHNPDDLALANRISAEIPAGNTGTLQLSSLVATNTGNGETPAADEPVTIHFTSANSYYLTYGPANPNQTRYPIDPTKTATYQSGQAITLPLSEEDPNNPGSQIPVAGPQGWSIRLTGTPSAGDVVNLSDAKTTIGDGYKLNAGNASAFLALRDAQVFDNGTTLSDGFAAAMAVVGTRTQSARYQAELTKTVATNLEADRTSVSGVNLDEEAARLLQYQQAYQASAKIIQTAQTLFDSMLNAVGR